MDTRVGEPAAGTDRFTFNFRSLKQNEEGSGSAAGSDDPFALVGEEPHVRLERNLAEVSQQLKQLTEMVSASGAKESLRHWKSHAQSKTEQDEASVVQDAF